MSTAKRITILLAISLVALCGSAQAFLMFTNTAPAGASWFTAGNWYESDPPNVSAVPTVANLAYVSSSWGPANVIVDGPGANVSNLHFGWAGFQANLTVQPGGELYVHSVCYVGFYSPAQLVINGGSFSGLDRLYVGYITASGPPREVEIVQYGGNVVLTNGSAEVYMNALADQQNYASGYPRYRLVDGMIKANYWYVGQYGYAKVEVEGGTNEASMIYVGDKSGGNGVYLQSGGLVKGFYRLCTGNTGAQGRYELSGGSCEGGGSGALFCGNGGTGTFIQSGGTNAPGSLYIGHSETGTGLYQISGGKMALEHFHVGTNGTFEITGDKPAISCTVYTQHAGSTLDLRLTNGVVSPINVVWPKTTTLDGTLNVTLLGPRESYPHPTSVVTVATFPSGGCTGVFNRITLAPASKLLSVRVNYNDTSITLDQWEYAPDPTVLIFRQQIAWSVLATNGNAVLWDMNAATFQTAMTADEGWVLNDLTAEVVDTGVRLRETGEGSEGSLSRLIKMIPSARYIQIKVGLAERADQGLFMESGGVRRKLFRGWNTVQINPADIMNGMLLVTLVQAGTQGEAPSGWADLERVRLVLERPIDGLILELLDNGRGDRTARIGDRVRVSYYPSFTIQSTTLEVDCFVWSGMSNYRFNIDPLVLENDGTGVFSCELTIDENAYAFRSDAVENVFGSVSCGGVDSYAYTSFALDIQAVLDPITGETTNALPPPVFAGGNPDIIKYRTLWNKYTEGVNLALGKTVLFPIPPDYEPTKEGETDAIDLTDGSLSTEPHDCIWFDYRAVGWYMGGAENGVMCLIDLGETQAVDRIVIRAQGGGAQGNLLFPSEFKVLISRDGETYFEAASLQKLMPGEKSQSDFERFFYLDELGQAYVYPFRLMVDAEARYIAISVVGATGAVFLDEIAVMARDTAQGSPSNVAYEGLGEKLVTEGIVVRPRIGELVLPSNVLLPNSFQIMDMRSGAAVGQPADLIIDLPVGAEIVQPANGISQELIEIDGEAYTRWRGTLHNKNAWAPRLTGDYFISPGNASIDGKPAYFSVVCEGVTNARVQIPIRVVEIPAVTPGFQRMHIGLDWMGIPVFPDMTAFFEDWQVLGYNSVGYSTEYLNGTLPQDAVAYFAEARSKGFTITMIDSPFHVMEKGHEPGAELFSQIVGEASVNLCPAYEGTYYDAEIERIAQTVMMVQPDSVFWDIECWYNGANEATRCSRCVAGQSASGKSMDAFLKDCGTKKMGDLYAAVQRGSAGRETPIVGSYNNHAVNPVHGLIMDFNQFYPNSVDLAMPSLYVVGRALDVHTSIRNNYQLLGEKKIIPWLTPGTYGQYPPYKLEQMILEALLNGACGITYFAYMDIDTPLQFFYQAKALAALAPYEDLLLDGEILTELKGSNQELTYSVVKKENELLLLIGNYRRSYNGSTVITLPISGTMEVKNLLDGTSWLDAVQGTTLSVEVPQDQVMLFHVKGTAP